MPVRLKNLINRLHHSFWLVPTLFAVGALMLGYGIQRLDLWYYGHLNWELTDPAGARAILTTVAGSSITVAGVVFSITMVVLSTASTQFGPRLIRNFMRHTQTKIVLGGFIGTFIYCLLVTATVRDGIMGWTPQIAVTTGGVFGILSFGLLISFIHHVAVFLQAPNVIEDVTDRLYGKIENLYPYSALPKEKHDAVRAGRMPENPGESRPLHFPKEGYLQAVDLAGLLKTAEENNALLKLHFKPGDFILPGEKIASLWEMGDRWEEAQKKVAASFIVGNGRTDDQDVEYAVDQLVEIAVRALSPGINDPFTAITCIRRLGALMATLAEKGLPGGVLHDPQGVLRVATACYTFSGLFDASFHPLRQNARKVETVAMTLMDTYGRLAEVQSCRVFARELKCHADLLRDDCKEGFDNPADFEDLMERYERLEKALG